VRDIWVISDTHFGHDNIIKYCGRPFKDAKEADEVMIENWNRTVKPSDIVYHLGDVHFYKKEVEAYETLKALQGHKRLIVGNHDDVPQLVRSGMFEKIMLWRVWKDFGIIMSHIPMHVSQLELKRFGDHMINVHGHIHDQDSPEGPYRNVSVEKIGYTPINIEELRTV